MNKRLLIISPYFPPTNAADMQRIRTSLPYFEQYGWDTEVVTVDPIYSDLPIDEFLLESVDPRTYVHYVKAFTKKITQKLGLGSIALRSLYFYRKKVDQLLAANKYDLIYFSTTQFPVCVLGPYWKKKFNIPYVIDMQDPWHSNYYQDKPKMQRPKKYWFSYRLNKYLERLAMQHVDGLISVSESYITDLKERYPKIKNIPAATLTFGAFKPDIEIARKHHNEFTILLNKDFKNLVYIGRGGTDMHKAIKPVFKAIKTGLVNHPELFNKLKLYFIGTSYAPSGLGKPTILPLAHKFGLDNIVVEITDRIGYYHALNTLQKADGIFIPGSDDSKYTASKIYQQLLVKKPVLAIFNKMSSAIKILQEYKIEHVYSYDNVDNQQLINFVKDLINAELKPNTHNSDAEKKYSAMEITVNQCNLFNKVINGRD